MGVSFRLGLPRRQLLLFIGAIFVPCAVLVTLGLRLMAQERQIEESRLVQEREHLVERTRQALISELDRMRLRQMLAVSNGGLTGSTVDEPVALVAGLRDGALVFPWDDVPAAVGFRSALNEGPFANRIREAERLELVVRRYDEAARLYRAAAGRAGDPAQQAYAGLLLARTLRKGERERESRAELERLLTTRPDLVDEHNVPLGLYAAATLVQSGAAGRELVQWVRWSPEAGRLISSDALRIARATAASIGDAHLESSLVASIRDRDQADELQRDVASLVRVGRARESVWRAFGNPVWLVGVTPPVATFDGLVLAVRAEGALKRLNASGEGIRLATSGDTAIQSLGDSFLGLRVVLPAPGPGAGTSRQPVLAIGLLLAVAFTIAAGSLLWRDVRREQRALEMRSQFVASVSHELRTPLTAIRMFSETLKLDSDVDRGTRAEYLDTILHESERLSRLVDNVLDFGKIERGQKTYRFEAVQLDEVLSKAARTAQYPLERAGFVLDVALERGLPAVIADADALQQAVLNLLSNAMKYSGSSRHIDLRLDRQNGHARIQVVDQGIGIAPNDQRSVFDRFYRVASGENQHTPGTGLGLTIVAHIAKAHGGRVAIDSSPGRGSAFTIHLPLHDDARSA